MLGRGPVKYGWDSSKRRGILTGRYIHMLLPGQNRERELKRFSDALEVQWDYYGPFGFAAELAPADEKKLDPGKKDPPVLVLEEEEAVFRTPPQIATAVMRIKESCR